MIDTVTPVCDFGWKAPDFELPGVDGATHRLDDLRGSTGIVVMFICNHCPYVKAILGRMVRDARELAGYRINVVAISSNDVDAYPADSFENMIRVAYDNDFPFPYLYDESQAVARAYDAQCTPDFFGFDGVLGLQYRGRLDESRDQVAPNARRELFEAMVGVAETGKGPVDQVASIGCSIKWRDGLPMAIARISTRRRGLLSPPPQDIVAGFSSPPENSRV
jgi:peroxiredoxin